MRQHLIILTIAVLLAGCGDRQSRHAPPPLHRADREQLEASIVRESTLMQQELLSENLDAFVAHTNPDVVKLMGGAGKMKETMQPGLKSMIKAIRKISLGKVSEIVDEGERLAAIVPVETRYSLPDGDILQITYRVAASEDGGKTWTFMDCQGQREQEALIRKMFPILSERVPFPPCGQKKL
jgi:hypothetical protein